MEVCQNIPGAYQAFLVDGTGLSVDGTTVPNVTHFNTLLNALPSQAPGGNVQVVSPNILNVFVPTGIISSAKGAHRFKLDNSLGHSNFDYTGELRPEIISRDIFITGTESRAFVSENIWCPQGKMAIGGGVTHNLSHDLIVHESGPILDTGWHVTVGKFLSVAIPPNSPIKIHVTCVNKN